MPNETSNENAAAASKAAPALTNAEADDILGFVGSDVDVAMAGITGIEPPAPAAAEAAPALDGSDPDAQLAGDVEALLSGVLPPNKPAPEPVAQEAAPAPAPAPSEAAPAQAAPAPAEAAEEVDADVLDTLDMMEGILAERAGALAPVEAAAPAEAVAPAPVEAPAPAAPQLTPYVPVIPEFKLSDDVIDAAGITDAAPLEKAFNDHFQNMAAAMSQNQQLAIAQTQAVASSEQLPRQMAAMHIYTENPSLQKHTRVVDYVVADLTAKHPEMVPFDIADLTLKTISAITKKGAAKVRAPQNVDGRPPARGGRAKATNARSQNAEAANAAAAPAALDPTQESLREIGELEAQDTFRDEFN